MSIADFNPKYVTPILKKLNGEEKFGFLIGNFNSNLMKIDIESGNSQFCNAMCSYFFTPLLLQSTRITDKSKTLIHNISFNSFEFTILSGNITHSISDHLIQFVILEDFITQKPTSTGCLCENWKPSFLPLLIFNWSTFSRRVTVCW